MVKMNGFWFVILLAVALHFCPLQGDDLTWSPPDLVSTMGTDAKFPQIAMDGNGNATAIWLESGYVKARYKPANGMWSSSIATLSNAGVSFARLVVDQTGNATAIWLENGVVAASSCPFGGDWAYPTYLSSSGASFIQMDVDSDGNVVAIWARNGNVESSTLLLNGTWPSSPDVIASENGANPSVAISSNGTVMAIWHGIVDSTYVIYVASKSISGSWSSEQSISTAGQNSAYPQIALDPNGNAIAIWYSFKVLGNQYSNVVVQAVSKPVNGSWTPPTNLSKDGARNPANLVSLIKMDEEGNAIAVWNTSFDGSYFSVESAIKPYNQTWTSQVDLVGLNFHSCSLDCSVKASGHVLTIYGYCDSISYMFEVQISQTDLKNIRPNFWSFPEIVSSGSTNSFAHIASTLSGNSVYANAIWLGYDGAHTLVYSSTGIGTNTQPPVNLSVSQGVNHFGLFDEYFNTLQWQPSSSLDIKGYRIFRNGLFLFETGPDVLEFIDHNRYQNESVTYGVAAVDDSLCQSSIININFP